MADERSLVESLAFLYEILKKFHNRDIMGNHLYKKLLISRVLFTFSRLRDIIKIKTFICHNTDNRYIIWSSNNFMLRVFYNSKYIELINRLENPFIITNYNFYENYKGDVFDVVVDSIIKEAIE